MRSLAALREQLSFIRYFYLTAAKPFEGILRKYSHLGASSEILGHYEEEKWQEAQKGLEVLGQCSLSLVSNAIKDYLREAVGSGMSQFRKELKSSWFDSYCSFLEKNTTLRWADFPVSLDQIEQINRKRKSNPIYRDTWKA